MIQSLSPEPAGFTSCNAYAFGKTSRTQDAAVAHFGTKHWEELLKFQPPDPAPAGSTGRLIAAYKGAPKDILDQARDNGRPLYLRQSPERQYYWVRIFRGTLKYNTLMPHCSSLTRSAMWQFLLRRGLKAMSWTTFVSGCQAPG